MLYLVLARCKDGSTQRVETQAKSPLEAQAQADAHLMYYQGSGIAEVLGIAEEPEAVPA